MFKKFLTIFPRYRTYFIFSAAVLLGGALFGYFQSEAIQTIVKESLEHLMNKVEEIQENPSPFNMFWVIFKNNVLAAMMMLGLGVFFAIFPVMSLFVNGALIGYLLITAQASGVNAGKLLVFGILPHGIVELTAILFSTMIGIKLGVLSFRLLTGLFQSRRRQIVSRDYAKHMSDLPYMVGLIIVLLFFAAVIESSVTPLLVETMMGDELKLLE